MYVPVFTGGEGCAMEPVQSPFRLHVDVDSATDEGAVVFNVNIKSAIDEECPGKIHELKNAFKEREWAPGGCGTDRSGGAERRR